MTTTINRALGIVALAASSGAVWAQSTTHGGTRFTATLTGAAEVPGPGDPDGRGTATIRINPGKSQLCFEIRVSNIAPATAAHVHIGSRTVAGPVSAGLAAPTSGTSSGCVTISRQLADAIRKNPQNYYVNVHNAAYPGGAVRGQLAR